jgi:tripartite-type tricarboxylate transporter receptor subunit TctC
LPETPTIYELLEAHKASDTSKRVTKVMLSSGDLGRPFFAPPGTPADRVKVLRAAFAKTMNDPELLAEAKKRGWDIDLTTGDELEKLAKEIMVQPPDVIERVKKMLGS